MKKEEEQKLHQIYNILDHALDTDGDFHTLAHVFEDAMIDAMCILNELLD